MSHELCVDANPTSCSFMSKETKGTRGRLLTVGIEHIPQTKTHTANEPHPFSAAVLLFYKIRTQCISICKSSPLLL